MIPCCRCARALDEVDGVLNRVLEEGLEHGARLLVDLVRDAIHSATPRQPPDRRLGDVPNVASPPLQQDGIV